MRYVVFDLDDPDSANPADRTRGTMLETFRTEESAKAFALHRMASGDIFVAVIDIFTGDQVFPPPDRGSRPAESSPGSGPRAAMTWSASERRWRKRTAG
jgi:hypothetical protein